MSEKTKRQFLFRWDNIFGWALFLFFVSTQLRASNTPRPIAKFFPSGVSQQHLLSNREFNNNLRAIASSPTDSISDTLRILAIRVEFQSDTLATTSGDGKFILHPDPKVILDPPPHDREYFRAQLVAMANYFRTVSRGKLILTGEVYPLQDEQAYLLPHSMDYYNPNQSKEVLDQRLAELLRDGFQEAYNQDHIPVADYDIYLLFHAGIGNDIATDYNQTPNDIPSAFLNFAHLQRTLGNGDPNFSGIEIDQGITIKEGIILPETESRPDLQIEMALKGIAVRLLGNQLGLPSLFNTETGRSGIGRWGLMDEGCKNYFGLIPAIPCAWSRVFMGWEEPEILTPRSGIAIAAISEFSAPRVYKIPINAHEYFLLENRQQDVNDDGVAIGYDQYGHRIEFYPDGQFTANIDTSAGERLGVITRVSEYDFGIPGSGILIWHIDDEIIERHLTENQVNANLEHRGVDLEEADGSQDIGQYFPFLSPGSGSEFGVAEDAWYADNEIHQIANKSKTVAFTPFTAPNSRSYSGAYSHIYLTNFSKRAAVMSFDYNNSTFLPGFPQNYASEPTTAFAVTSADLDDDQQPEILATLKDGTVLAWKSDGSSFISHGEGTQLSLFVDPGKPLSGPVAVADVIADTFPEVVATSRDGILWIWSTDDQDGNGLADTLLTYTIADSITTFPTVDSEKNIVFGTEAGQIIFFSAAKRKIIHSVKISDSAVQRICQLAVPSGIMAATESGEIVHLSLDGKVISKKSLFVTGEITNIISGYLDSTQVQRVVFTTDAGQLWAINTNGEVLPGFPVRIDGVTVSSPVLADFDSDGFGEIICFTNSAIYAFNHNGTLCNYFPFFPHESGTLFAASSLSPILADVTGDGTCEILTSTINGDILAITRNCKIATGFPLTAGATISATMLANDVNNDGKIELFALATDGKLYGWRTEGVQTGSEGILWNQFQYDAAHSGCNSAVSSQPPIKSPGKFLSTVYNYPNPTAGPTTTIRYYLRGAAQVQVKIFDLTGNQVAELCDFNSTPGDNEIVWNVGNLESGIYIARVEARGEQQGVSFIKIAVMK